MNGDGGDTISLDNLKSLYFQKGAAPAARPVQQARGNISLDDLKHQYFGTQPPTEEQAIGKLQGIVNQPKSWETKAGEFMIPTGMGMAGGAVGATLGAPAGAAFWGGATGAGVGQTMGGELVRAINRYMHGQETDPAEVEGIANKLGIPSDRSKLELVKHAGVNIGLNAAVDWLFPALKYQLGGKSAESMLNEVYGVGERGAAEFGRVAESAEQSVAAQLGKSTEQEAEKVAPAARLEQIAGETGRTPETAATSQMTAQPGEPTPVGEHLQYQAPENFGVNLSQPREVAQWAQTASPEDKLTMKEKLGDHMAAAPNRLAINDPTQASMWAQAWKALDPKSKFANPDNILFVNGKLNQLVNSPENYQRFLEGAGKAAMPVFDAGARTEVEGGRKILQDLGPLGKETLLKVNAATAEGPQAQALIMRKYFQSLNRPGMAAQIYQQTGHFGRSVPEQVLKAAGLIDAPENVLPRGLSRASRPGAMPWIIATGGASAVMTGHIPQFLGLLAAYGTIKGGQRMLANSLIKEATQKVVQQSAREAAEESGAAVILSAIANSPFADSAISNLSAEAYESLGSIIFRHASVDATKKATEYYGPRAYAAVEEKFGPMVKDIARTQAKNIASPERRIDSGHIDNIQKVHEQVQSGKTPNIQRDLNSGRLSTAEARRMVEKTGTDPGSMFKGMTLNEAIDAYVKGTDDEKSLALAPLAQKLNDEGRSLPPEQRRAFMARIRQALPQGEESMPGPGDVAEGGS